MVQEKLQECLDAVRSEHTFPRWEQFTPDLEHMFSYGWKHLEDGGDYSSLTKAMRIEARSRALPIWVIALGIKILVEILLRIWTKTDAAA